MEAHNYLYQFGNTKEEIEKFTEQVNQEIKDGFVSEYKFHGIATALIKGLTKCLESNLANINTGVKHEGYGFKFTPKEAGVRFDFSNCQHPGWNSLSESERSLTEKKKDIEATLKSLKEPMVIIDEETGEAVKVYPAVKKSKTIIEVR